MKTFVSHLLALCVFVNYFCVCKHFLCVCKHFAIIFSRLISGHNCCDTISYKPSTIVFFKFIFHAKCVNLHNFHYALLHLPPWLKIIQNIISRTIFSLCHSVVEYHTKYNLQKHIFPKLKSSSKGKASAHQCKILFLFQCVST